MHSYTIIDTRQFMSLLLAGSAFHAFEVVQADLVTYAAFHIDGTYYPDYFDREEQEESAEAGGPDSGPDAVSRKRLIPWKMLQPHAFELIRGRHKPISLKLVLRLSEPSLQRFLEKEALPLRPHDVAGLYLNISYDRTRVTCVTGTALTIFSPDKSLDHAWDEAVRELFRRHEIAAADTA